MSSHFPAGQPSVHTNPMSYSCIRHCLYIHTSPKQSTFTLVAHFVNAGIFLSCIFAVTMRVIAE